MTAPISHEQLQRNPYLVTARDHYDVGPSGGDAVVYPLVEMKSNYLSHAGTHTSACGTTAYRGDMLGRTFQNSLFACEPIGHLVTRSIIKPAGATLTAERARPDADFLASTDTWFRPASLATGPDGALYLADMYRLWVEHPKFLPAEIAKRLDWRAGDDRGRIWRIAPGEKQTISRPLGPTKTTEDLVAMLADANGWRRQLGQRLLVERQVKDAAPLLRLLLGGNVPFARLHALWTLDGLGELTSDDVRVSLDDPDVHVRRDAVKLSARFVKEDASLIDHLAGLVDDQEARVRFEIPLALGETDDPRATPLLTKLALRNGGTDWFATAILTATKQRSGAILASLVGASEVGDGFQPGLQHLHLVRELATVVGARGEPGELGLVLHTIGSSERSGVWWQNAALSGLARGLPRHQGALGRVSLPKLLASPPNELAEAVAPVRTLLARTTDVALDGRLPAGDRAAAIELLGYQPFEQAASAYEKLLAANQPVEVQLACIAAMQKSRSDQAATIVLQHWPAFGPRVRPPALALLLGRVTAMREVLEAMAAGQINPAIIDIDQRVRLLRHRDESIKALAEKLFGGAVSANRREVAERYMAALNMKASATEGMKLFDRVCAKCHRIDGRGHEVGPDISDVRNRSRDALLYDILDPNQKLEPRFTDYLVATDDGRVFNGLMVSETAEAIVLRQPEGKQLTIARNEIAELRASSKSLMPEGVEKELTVQQMADLLEYLKARDRADIKSSGPDF